MLVFYFLKFILSCVASQESQPVTLCGRGLSGLVHKKPTLFYLSLSSIGTDTRRIHRFLIQTAPAFYHPV